MLPFVWGLCLLLSWVGWGAALEYALKLNRGARVDWALRAGWGMAVVLALGGLMNLLQIISYETVGAIVLSGVVFAGLDIYQRLRVPHSRARLLGIFAPRKIGWHLPLWLLAGYLYLGSIECQKFNWNDDLTSYLMFARRMLESGTLIEPFSWRRLSTYGGQQFLQAQVLVLGSDFHMNMIDIGLSPLIFAGLAYGMIRPRTPMRRALALLVVLALLFLPVPRINTQSQASGAVLFLTLLRTMRFERLGRRRSYAAAVALGIIGAGISTLRMNFLPAAVLAIGLSYAGRMLLFRAVWRTYARRLLLAAAVFLLALGPWAIVLYQSSKSLMYPLMRGLQRPEYTAVMEQRFTLAEKVWWVAGFLLSASTLAMLAPMLLSFRRRFVGDLLPFCAAALASSIVMATVFTRSDYDNIYRYCFAMLAAGNIAAILWVLLRLRHRLLHFVALGALLLVPIVNLTDLIDFQTQAWDWVRNAATNPTAFVVPSLPSTYQEAQQAVPPGKAFLAVTSQPIFFDFRRNIIHNVDLPGAASPDPGMPIFDGPAAVKHYLQAQGIDYIVCVDFTKDRALYARRFWTQVARHPSSYSATDQVIYKFTLQFLDDMDELVQTEDLVYNQSPLRVIRLR